MTFLKCQHVLLLIYNGRAKRHETLVCISFITSLFSRSYRPKNEDVDRVFLLTSVTQPMGRDNIYSDITE